MQEVEFFEMIGRVAIAYWEANTEHLEDCALAKKIEFVIDSLFGLIDQKIAVVNENVSEDSETDEDY